MTASIKLSQNELWALLRRTFEALYGHKRDYYDMARSVLWLECHGHHGVSQLMDALKHLEKQDLAKPVLLELDAQHLKIDGNGHSLFCLSRSICDLAMAAAFEKGSAQVSLVNVPDSKPLLGVLNYAASQGFAALAFYNGAIARFSIGDDFPTIYADENKAGVSLVCAQSNKILDNFSGRRRDILMDIQAQNYAYTSSLEQGLRIKHAHYDILTEIANRVLVEASEASRLGAGE